MARGHLQKRGDVWYAYVDYPRDPATPHKRNQKAIRLPGASTRKDAERELTRLLREIDTGTVLEPSKLTLAQFLDQWLASEAPNRVRPTTLDSYGRMIRLHIAPALGRKKLQAVRPTDVAAFYRALDTPAAAMKCRTVLSVALKSAVVWGYIPTNPVRDVTPPKYKVERGDAWSKEECAAFLIASRPFHWWPAYRLELGSGLRQGELLDLRWEDVDFDQAAITVRRTAVWASNQYLSHPPKNGQPRVVTLDPDTLAALRLQRTRQNQRRLRAGGDWLDEDRVFSRADGGVVNRCVLSQRYRRDLKKAGVRPIRFHDLRHTHATLLLDAGMPLKAVSARLGHANIGITADVYQHVTDRMGRELADAIGAILAV